MRTLTKKEKQLVMRMLKNCVHRENYGIWKPEPERISVRDEIEFTGAGWRIDWNGGALLLNGEKAYHLRKKYSSKKTAGSYKTLLPVLEYLG